MNKIVLIIIALLVGAGGGFYGGLQYQKNKNPLPNFQSLGNGTVRLQGGQGIVARNGGSGGFLGGEILKKDENSITVKLNGQKEGETGGSKTVYYSDSTAVNKSVDGTKDDLAVGQNVMVSGTANSDGSIVAQLVQIRPEGDSIRGAGQ